MLQVALKDEIRLLRRDAQEGCQAHPQLHARHPTHSPTHTHPPAPSLTSRVVRDVTVALTGPSRASHSTLAAAGASSDDCCCCWRLLPLPLLLLPLALAPLLPLLLPGCPDPDVLACLWDSQRSIRLSSAGSWLCSWSMVLAATVAAAAEDDADDDRSVAAAAAAPGRACNIARGGGGSNSMMQHVTTAAQEHSLCQSGYHTGTRPATHHQQHNGVAHPPGLVCLHDDAPCVTGRQFCFACGGVVGVVKRAPQQ